MVFSVRPGPRRISGLGTPNARQDFGCARGRKVEGHRHCGNRHFPGMVESGAQEGKRPRHGGSMLASQIASACDDEPGRTRMRRAPGWHGVLALRSVSKPLRFLWHACRSECLFAGPMCGQAARGKASAELPAGGLPIRKERCVAAAARLSRGELPAVSEPGVVESAVLSGPMRPERLVAKGAVWKGRTGRIGTGRCAGPRGLGPGPGALVSEARFECPQHVGVDFARGSVRGDRTLRRQGRAWKARQCFVSLASAEPFGHRMGVPLRGGMVPRRRSNAFVFASLGAPA